MFLSRYKRKSGTSFASFLFGKLIIKEKGFKKFMGFVIYKVQYLFLFVLFFSINSFSQESPLIYSKHWYGDKPFFSKTENNQQEMLLIHDLFTVSFDLSKRFPRWIAYQLSPHLTWGFLKEERSFKKDSHLLDHRHFNITLSLEDYKGASNFHYDKGHLAPLGSFKASVFSYQLQYLSNIVPQMRNLNRGPWMALEIKIREFVKKGNELRVMVGTLYGDKSYGKPYKKILAPWPKINGKIQQLPSGFWKLVVFKNKGILKTCSFIMPQDISNRRTSIKKYIVTRAVLKEYTGLSFLKGVKASLIDNCSFLD